MQTTVNEYMEKGLAGEIADIGYSDIVTRVNAYGDTIPFGVFVTKGPMRERPSCRMPPEK